MVAVYVSLMTDCRTCQVLSNVYVTVICSKEGSAVSPPVNIIWLT